ncbi:aldo/keto reductase [Enterococcus sp. 669A]|uniref:Aldo/keto reductase n=1 Tax=Candidatus Enterococcus moelleringii TaxID=2815325 RepID=A0ABS3LHF9_9ENTE|nr:aldo/keto reductase [Enterococcus sp. 669A]MBO1308146.1 aldo/keto reductase [Enterococcus sp. 669A]
MKIELGQKKVPPIGLGTWHMGDDLGKRQQEIKALQAGIEAGAQVIDTAEMYGDGRSERLVGEAIAPYDRNQLYLISKFYPWHADKENLQYSLEQSLSRLQTDYLDLYLLHWPGKVPLEETVGELERLKQAGWIRQWGVSNFDTSDMRALYGIPKGKDCLTNQVLYNLASRGIEYDLLPWMREHRLPLIAYSPIAQGDTLGGGLLDNPLLQEIAAAHEATIFQILLAWVIRDGKTIAIPQSGKAQHVLDNLQAMEIQLTPMECQLLNNAFPKPVGKQPLDIL